MKIYLQLSIKTSHSCTMDSVCMREDLLNISPDVLRKDCVMLFIHYCKPFQECKGKLCHSRFSSGTMIYSFVRDHLQNSLLILSNIKRSN